MQQYINNNNNISISSLNNRGQCFVLFTKEYMNYFIVFQDVWFTKL